MAKKSNNAPCHKKLTTLMLLFIRPPLPSPAQSPPVLPNDNGRGNKDTSSKNTQEWAIHPAILVLPWPHRNPPFVRFSI